LAGLTEDLAVPEAGDSGSDTDLLRILIVDDDDVDRLAVRRTITRSALGMSEITDAADAPAALKLLLGDPSRGSFDCVLLDFTLAGDTGLDVLREMRGTGDHTAVVMLTGQSDPLSAAAAMKAGATDFLTKDLLKPERLEQVIRSAMRVAEAERAADATNARLAEAHELLQDQAAELKQQVEEAAALTAELEEANEHLQEVNAEVEAARAEVETLNRIGSALAAELNVERIVQTVTDAATAISGAQFGAFFYNVVDENGAKLSLFALTGAPRAAFENFGHPRPTPIFAPTFYGTGIMRSDDITEDPRYGKNPPNHGMPPGHLPVRSYLAVPVMSRTGDVIGGLFFGHGEPGIFTERAERIVVGIAGWAAVAMDNARLYEAERKARDDAEEANKAKSAFLANMSHELRTPLNAIGGYADLLVAGIRGPISDVQRGDIERIKRSQHHLLSLINDILNFAKLEAGRVRFDFRDVQLQTALTQIEALVGPQLQQKGISYEHTCQSEVRVNIDPERLQQILLNLLSNAIKFTPSGGKVTVSCHALAETVNVCVTDTGVGIPQDKLEQIFEPFVQLDRGQTPSNAGTGLGLAISRDLARAMGGELTASSKLEEGSTFTLSLPRQRSGAS
jgi:signal transduction histidine kinase/FixJ family two-component response regulator